MSVSSSMTDLSFDVLNCGLNSDDCSIGSQRSVDAVLRILQTPEPKTTTTTHCTDIPSIIRTVSDDAECVDIGVHGGNDGGSLLEEVPGAPARNYWELKVPQLKAELKSRGGLKVSGCKRELVARLENHDREQLDLISVGSDDEFHDDTLFGDDEQRDETSAAMLVENDAQPVVAMKVDASPAEKTRPDFMNAFDDDVGDKNFADASKVAWQSLTDLDLHELMRGPMLKDPLLNAAAPRPPVMIVVSHNALQRFVYVLQCHQPHLGPEINRIIWHCYYGQQKQHPIGLAFQELVHWMGAEHFEYFYHLAMRV